LLDFHGVSIIHPPSDEIAQFVAHEETNHGQNRTALSAGRNRSSCREIYARIKPQVDPGNDGKILAIDIESGEYEVDDNEIEAVGRLFSRLPDPEVFVYKIGYRTSLSFAGSLKRIAS
jgi:hypothetical protein